MYKMESIHTGKNIISQDHYADNELNSHYKHSIPEGEREMLEDTNLKIRGNVMHEWMLIAQAFAGPPASGPKAGERAIVI